MTHITMIIPTYNDLNSLTALIEKIEATASKRVKYLIVDNGSTQLGVSSTLERRSLYWQSIRLEHNQGFGGGIKAGISAANSEWVGWMPGNLKILPTDVENIVTKSIFTPRSLVKCRRKRKSIIAQNKTLAAGLIQTVLTRTLMFDTGGTPTICEKSFFNSIENLPDDYVLESRILFEARCRGMKISRPLIPYGERSFGESHWQKGVKSEIALMQKIVKDLRKARKLRP